MQMKPHEVMRLRLPDDFVVNAARESGYVQILDPGSVLVGVVMNRDRDGRFMTAMPLVPYLAQGGLERTDVFFSRLQISSDVKTGSFILNPNDNEVELTVTAFDQTGMMLTPIVKKITGRGTFPDMRESLGPFNFPLSMGYFNLQAQAREPGRRVRLITFATYRSGTYFSAIPPQRPVP
jgi:hypothetical protein